MEKNCKNSFIKSGLRECGYYEIYRRPDYISQYTKIATIVNDKNEEESYEDVDVFSGGKYYYYIVSYSADVSDDPENPVFVVTQTEKISISWLSNVYKVTMMLCSEAGETFGLKNVKVKLSLPKELQLAQILYLV